MSAPTVTRPSASTVEDPKLNPAAAPQIDWAQYVKWGLAATIVLSVLGLVYSLVVGYSETSRTDKLRAQWDEFYNATEKKSDDERIEALEKLADNAKIKGTAVHAYVLASLAHTHLEIAQNPRRQVEAQRDALERAIAIDKLLSENEPFASNPMFGPVAVQNLALALEQKQINNPGVQFYDEAIKVLRHALFTDDIKEASPSKTMKSHFLFYKMNAQLGRLYWLRGLRTQELEAAKKADEPKVVDAAKKDNEWALYYIKEALGGGTSSVEKDRFGAEFKGAWREEAAYLKSLLDPAGKLMASGVPPAMRIPKVEAPKPIGIAPAPTGATVNGTIATITTVAPHTLSAGQQVTVTGVTLAGFNGTFTVLTASNPTTFTYAVPAGLTASGGGTATRVEAKKDEPKKDEAKKEEPKKDEAKKDEPKKDEPKKVEPKKDEPKKTDEKKDEKKPASVEPRESQQLASDTGGASQHLSYAQIQAMLKQGRPALCQCPRCANSEKNVGAKLAE